VTALIKHKKNNPRDTTNEEELTIWKVEEKSSMSVQNFIGRILGTFRWNYARLNMTIHIQSYSKKTIPISEPILRAIRNDEGLTTDEQDAIDLMAYGAERIRALNELSLTEVHLIEIARVRVTSQICRRAA
jgi:hypothetical protein